MSGKVERVLTEAARLVIAAEPNAQLDCLSVVWNMADGTDCESPMVYYWHMHDMQNALATAMAASAVEWADVTSFGTAVIKNVKWPI